MSSKFIEFFTDGIEASISLQGLSVDKLVKVYLSQLLADSIDLGLNIVNSSSVIPELYFKALDSDTINERNSYLKMIGDLSLIKLGMFPESIPREMVRPSFYRNMGLDAFSIIADEKLIYRKLAIAYDDCISVLHGYKKSSDINNIPNLYEFWKITDSKFAFKRLVNLGFQFSYWNNINIEE